MNVTVFKLAELKTLYNNYLLGSSYQSKVCNTRGSRRSSDENVANTEKYQNSKFTTHLSSFKERLLNVIP